ncbi:MAG: phosphatidylserine decarboxylase [Planctomycetes bacterium]|nr:phosphatidylserine decarboxylase [Planctomycetota bacterium]
MAPGVGSPPRWNRTRGNRTLASMTRAFRLALSHLVGWLVDRRIPGPLRRLVYGTYCRLTGADPSSAQLGLEHYPSLGAFFVRRLQPDARPLAPDPALLISPCDGHLQASQRIDEGTLLQAKGMAYPLAELLGGASDGKALEGGQAFTIYLSPRDYHRVHAPLAADLVRVSWLAGDRFSVAPGVLSRRPRVLARNERAVLELSSELGPYYLVMVGALNVGRIRVVGVAPGTTPDAARTPHFERGAELARFEMGSTVVLVFPAGLVDPLGLAQGAPLKLGEPLGRLPGRVASR